MPLSKATVAALRAWWREATPAERAAFSAELVEGCRQERARREAELALQRPGRFRRRRVRRTAKKKGRR